MRLPHQKVGVFGLAQKLGCIYGNTTHWSTSICRNNCERHKFSRSTKTVTTTFGLARIGAFSELISRAGKSPVFCAALPEQKSRRSMKTTRENSGSPADAV